MAEILTKDGLVKYGKNNGYTTKEINKVVNVERNNLIKYGIDNNYKANEINKVLKNYGYQQYNPATTLYNYQQLGPNFVQNATNMARDLRTFGGAMVEPLVNISRDVYNAKWGDKQKALKQSFKNAVNDDSNRKLYRSTAVGTAAGALIPRVGPVGGGLLGAAYGMSGNVKNLANAILSSYDTNLDELVDAFKGKTSRGELLNNIVQGAFRNPLYATLDTAPVTGRAVSKVASKMPDYMPNALREIFPDQKSREFNRQLSQSVVGAKAKTSDVYQGYLQLDSMPMADRKEILRYVTTNEGKLDNKSRTLGDTIVRDLRAAEKEFIDRGYLDPSVAKSNAIAQYVMQFLDDDRILHGHIASYVEAGQHLRDTRGQIRISTGDPSDLIVQRILETEPELKSKIDNLAKKADKLYDDKKISFFTQKFAPSRDPLGNVIAGDIAREGEGYFGTKRIVGKTNLDDWSKVMDDSLKFQLDELSNIMEVEDVVSDIIKKYNIEDATNLTKEALEAKRLEGKEAFSQQAFKDYIKQHFESGREINISKALRHAQTAGEGSKLIDKIYLKAIDNAFKKPVDKGGRRLLNSFKKAVLANPHWIILNRIGNLTNNYMNGVMMTDYAEAWMPSNKKYIPRQLKQQTSFNSYINSGVEGNMKGASSTLLQPINRLIRAKERLGVSDKGIGDYWKAGTEMLAASSDITANPLFRFESALELTDRYANMIRQAKRMASKTKGKTWKQILKEADQNNDLFNKLNTDVNKSLGDYVGRNYMLPSGYYNLLGETIPFYRFLTQTLRTTGNQIVHHPASFMSNITLPSRMGNDLSEYFINEYNLDKSKYKGGVPYSKEATGDIRTIAFEPLPIGAVSEDLGEILKAEDLTSILSPYLTSIPDILKFQRFNRMATTPNNINKDENYKPTLSDIAAYGANTLASTLYNPYRLSTTYIPELFSLFRGTGLQSRYDTNPLVQNPDTYMRTLPVELIGRWAGIQTNSNYPVRNKSKRKQQREKRQKIYREKTREKLINK